MTTGADPEASVAFVNRLDAFRHFAKFRSATTSGMWLAHLNSHAEPAGRSGLVILRRLTRSLSDGLTIAPE